MIIKPHLKAAVLVRTYLLVLTRTYLILSYPYQSGGVEDSIVLKPGDHRESGVPAINI